MIEYLEINELVCAIRSESWRRLIIAASVDSETECMTLWAGDGASYCVAFAVFSSSGMGVSPDFNEVSIIDFGQTIKLGDYEASVDSILSDANRRFVVRQQSVL